MILYYLKTLFYNYIYIYICLFIVFDHLLSFLILLLFSSTLKSESFFEYLQII
jgi:hypothetical protein